MSEGEKRHEPTPQKLLISRRKGQVAKSQTFTQLFQLVGVVLGIGGGIRLFWSSSEMLLQYQEVWDLTGIIRWVYRWMSVLAQTVGIVVVSGGVGTVMGELMQVGMQIHLQPLSPDCQRLNLFTGCKRVFTGLKDFWLVCMKFTAGIGLAAWMIIGYSQQTSFWVSTSDLFIISQLKGVFVQFGILMLLCFFGIAIVERVYRKKQFLKEQRMTEQELKQELKDSEGDPYVRSEQRLQRQQLLFSELPGRVRRAKVIIVDKRPKTHQVSRKL